MAWALSARASVPAFLAMGGKLRSRLTFTSVSGISFACDLVPRSRSTRSNSSGTNTRTSPMASALSGMMFEAVPALSTVKLTVVPFSWSPQLAELQDLVGHLHGGIPAALRGNAGVGASAFHLQ